jgi:pimeloyl-ACP methyl ester carboxylesterase
LKLIAAVAMVLLALLAYWLWTPDRDRAALEAKYANAPDDFIEVAGIRLHVRESGPKTAPAVILLHGFGSSLHTWEAWAQTMSRSMRVIRFDLPGAGLTGPDPKGDYTDARALEILAALMDRLGVARASLVGNSIGGRIAWTFAAKNPARVDKLVLVSPDGFASPGFQYGRAPEVPAFLGAMRYVLPKAILRMNLEPAYADPARLGDAVVTRYHDLMLVPGVRDAMLARMRQTVLQDPRPLLKQIAAPVLLLWGEKDAMIPVANAQDYVKVLKQSMLVVLPGLAHVPQEEAAERSLVPVQAFLGN